jgi:hypothetical protein
MSAKGFREADDSQKKSYAKSGALQYGIQNTMNVFYTLYNSDRASTSPLPGHTQKLLGNVIRNSEVLDVSKYYSFPLFADGKSDGIHTNIWQHLDFMAPGLNPSNNPYSYSVPQTDGNWAPVDLLLDGTTRIPYSDNAALLPNMIVNIHSGIYNPRSFATVNTIEIVNGNIYLTTIQRKYAPPIY